MNLNNEKESFKEILIKQLIALVKHLSHLLHQKKELVTKPNYKLVDWIVKQDTGEGFCRIQVIGTAQVADYKPNDIISDDEFVRGLHQEDVRTITNLANLELNKPKSKMIAIDYDGEKKVILKNNNGKQVCVSIDEIKKDRSLLEKVSKKDAFDLGRVVGDDDSLI